MYLKDIVVPKFIQDLCSLEVSPMDGQTLTEALHAHGINVRYIGQVRHYMLFLNRLKYSFFIMLFKGASMLL